MTSRGMEDKENVHGNMWHSHQQDNNNSEAKHEKKRVAFQCEEGEERAAAPRPLASCRGSDDDFNNNNHSTNVTPSNQTSEILQEKMRELREKLEKLKSKGRKSGTDGIDGGGGTAPSSPMLEQESSSSEAPDRNPKEPKQLSKQQISPCAVSSTEPSRSSSPLTPATPSTPLLNTPPGPSSSSATATSSAVSAPSTKSSKPRLKLPTPLGTSSSVTARKKPRLPGPGSLLSKPAQRVSVDEARAQSEEPAVVEEAMPSPSPLPSADVFRAPVSKRDAIKSAEPKLEMARPEARMEVIEVDNVAAKKESTSSSEAALDKVAQRREARRSREMKAAAAAARQAEREKDGMRKQEQTAEAYPSLEIVNITADTASSRPLNNTAVTTTATMSTESGYRSTASSQTIDTAPETPKHSEAREAGERTREQDRPNKPMDTSTDQGQDPQAQEKALFALACQRGALEFLHGFAAGGTSFLTVNGRRYMKLDQIGRGGSSKVYRVVSPNWSTYALKYVPLKNTDTVTEESYLNEISLLKKLSHHDNIIRLVDSEVRPGGIFLLLEFAELDLDRMLRAQQQRNRAIAAEAAKESGPPMPSNLLPSFVCLNSVRLFWQQMLEAVHTIHEERVVHGDLKPANFVCIQGRLKLIDFGIAKAISNDTTNIVRDNQIGTLNYISPEALIDTSSGQNTKFKLGRPSDIWSLGCILYQMVYGRSPFAMLDNMIRKLQAISNPKYKIDYPPIDNPPLMETMRLCLQFDPRRRPSIPELLKHPFLQ